MNPPVSEDDQHSSGTVESSSEQRTVGLNLNIDDGMKRATVKELIEKYFYQLIDGCGNDGCNNENCASSGKLASLSPNEAAGMALKLWKSDAKLCDPHPAKIARTTTDTPSSTNNSPGTPVLNGLSHNHTTGGDVMKVLESSGGTTGGKRQTSTTCGSKNVEPPKKTILTERRLHKMIEECKSLNNYSHIRKELFVVFSNQEFLSQSFRKATTREQLEENLPQHILDSLTPEQLAQYNFPSITLLPPTTQTSSDSSSSLPKPTPTISSSTGDSSAGNSNSSTSGNSTSITGSGDINNSSNTLDSKSISGISTACGSNSSSSSACGSNSSSTARASNSSSTDCASNSSSSSELTLDLESLRRAYEELFSLPNAEFESVLVQALVTLSEYLNVQLKAGSSQLDTASLVHTFLLIFEIPSLGSCEYVEKVLPKVCKAASQLPLPAQASIARIWATHCKSRLKTILEALQQLITIKTISNHYHKDYIIQDEETITLPTKIMRILFYANILAGDLDPASLRHPEPQDAEEGSLHESVFGVDIPSSKPSQHTPPHEDPLGKLLGVSVLDARRPLLPFLEFYNEPLSDAIEMDRDFGYYRASEELAAETHECGPSARYVKFSFMYYAFILSPATKTLGLYYDSRIRMYSGRRISYLQSVVGQPTNPYLRLKVRREHIIEDALVELEMIAMENDKDLKKQLVVEFEGEQGIDEGGVSKEFFQLIVEEIFNPDYGMFVAQAETNQMWFNQMSFESDAQFTLVGILLGLAIYNNIILDVNFPMVVYKKLMGKRGSFHDLEDFHPSLHRGLVALLQYQGEDIEEALAQTFRICYTDPFGAVLSHDLKPNGDNIAVNHSNKQAFVDAYADFLLNSAVDKQFRAFRRGFQMVTDESPLALLFRPEEIEQLVCGSRIFDLHELQDATEYDAGYTPDTPVIRHFWEIVHALPPESQKKLLQFTTGSDRIPVGGFSKLKMFIARIGPDSDRLPTAHTCFNVLLLPEYATKEKLQDRLLKAINYSKGFGML